MDNCKYFWIRVFDYNYERDSDYESESYGKGIMLDEFYIKGEDLTREQVKLEVRDRYAGKTAQEIAFAKPKKKNGIYAIVMDSEKFFYNRFCVELDTYCFYCHKPIKGRLGQFDSIHLSDIEDDERFVYFCSYDCKYKFRNSIHYEGEFQNKEEGCSGNVFGYIYLIYNRVENTYYVGQTRYLPFFRWQEHIKSGGKGDIKDLSFSIITEVPKGHKISQDENQQELNNVEAWWIAKYKEEGYKVFNISNPRLTIEHYKKRFNEMVANNHQFGIEEVTI